MIIFIHYICISSWIRYCNLFCLHHSWARDLIHIYFLNWPIVSFLVLHFTGFVQLYLNATKRIIGCWINHQCASQQINASAVVNIDLFLCVQENRKRMMNLRLNLFIFKDLFNWQTFHWCSHIDIIFHTHDVISNNWWYMVFHYVENTLGI